MALKPLRIEDRYGYRLNYHMNEAASAGGVVVASTIGSGSAMDQSQDVVTYAANPSGKVPVGMLLGDVVDKDLTQTTLQRLSSEYIKNGKVPVNAAGQYTTNMIYPGLTIAKDQSAYLGPSGLLQNTVVNEVNNPWVGTFESSKDADGYAKVTINLPAKR
jgi:hypothetical protein